MPSVREERVLLLEAEGVSEGGVTLLVNGTFRQKRTMSKIIVSLAGEWLRTGREERVREEVVCAFCPYLVKDVNNRQYGLYGFPDPVW